MMDYKHFRVKRYPDGTLKAAVQLRRNTIFPGTAFEDGGIQLSVSEKGICVNGDYGTNPTARMIQETADLFCEAADAYRRLTAPDVSMRPKPNVNATQN